MNHPKALLTGYLTVLVVVLLVAGFSWRLWDITRKGHEHVMVSFDGSGELIGALQPDDPVLVRGVNVGQVQSISAVPGGVRVLLRFWGHQILNQDALAVNTSHSLMGQRVIDLFPGRDSLHPLAKDQTIPGEFDPGIAETMSQIYKVLDAVTTMRRVIVAMVQGDTHNRALHDKIMGIVDALDRVVSGMETLRVDVQKTGPLLDRVGSKTRSVTNDLPGIEKNFGRAMLGADSLLLATQTAIRTIKPLLDSTHHIMASLHDTTGPMRHMLLDDSILIAASHLDASLGSLMEVMEGSIPLKFNFHFFRSNLVKPEE